MNRKLPLAVTIGDPAGIGPDIVIFSWLQRRELSLPAFLLIGSQKLIEERAKQMKIDIRTVSSTAEEASYQFDKAIPVLNVFDKYYSAAGSPNPNDVPHIIAEIETAVNLVMSDKCAALVTGPVCKKNLYNEGFPFPGHTEFLAAISYEKTGIPVQPVMMLVSPYLKTIPVTIHTPLKDVSRALTEELIEATIEIATQELHKKFSIMNPHIMVAGLNPHAGENGTLGLEEKKLINPVIKKMAAKGHNISGPASADTMFHEQARKSYDVAVCMYHDQALIPVKTLAFNETVNVTLGLPFIRTSPDHGTAFEIAGKKNADPSSFIKAVFLANQIALRQHNK